MDLNKPWTVFALEAEVERHGFARICSEHNRVVKLLEGFKKKEKVSREIPPIDHEYLASVVQAAKDGTLAIQRKDIK